MATVSFIRDCSPVEILDMRGNLKSRLQCSSCGAHEEWDVANRVPPERVRKYYLAKGWSLAGRPRCPACQSRKKEPKPMATVTNIEPKATAPIAANTDAARKNKRLVIVTLEDCYNETKRRYNDGHSDATVAKELDLVPGFVALVREEFYGKMAEPSEITELRAKLSELTTAAADLSAKLTSLCARNGWAP